MLDFSGEIFGLKKDVSYFVGCVWGGGVQVKWRSFIF